MCGKTLLELLPFLSKTGHRQPKEDQSVDTDAEIPELFESGSIRSSH